MTNPLGGINQLFPLFGIANQLLAAVALTVGTTLLIKAGKLKWAWVTGIPLAWDAAVTLTASWQKVFSDDPKIGFFAQRDTLPGRARRGQGAAAGARTWTTCRRWSPTPPSTASSPRCSRSLVIIVILDASRVWFKAIRAREPLPTTEAPYVESQIVAPGRAVPDRRGARGAGRRRRRRRRAFAREERERRRDGR